MAFSVKQVVMLGPTREKSKESEKHHFQAQNDLILIFFKIEPIRVWGKQKISPSTLLNPLQKKTGKTVKTKYVNIFGLKILLSTFSHLIR